MGGIGVESFRLREGHFMASHEPHPLPLPEPKTPSESVRPASVGDVQVFHSAAWVKWLAIGLAGMMVAIAGGLTLIPDSADDAGTGAAVVVWPIALFFVGLAVVAVRYRVEVSAAGFRERFPLWNKFVPSERIAGYRAFTNHQGVEVFTVVDHAGKSVLSISAMPEFKTYVTAHWPDVTADIHAKAEAEEAAEIEAAMAARHAGQFEAVDVADLIARAKAAMIGATIFYGACAAYVFLAVWYRGLPGAGPVLIGSATLPIGLLVLRWRFPDVIRWQRKDGQKLFVTLEAPMLVGILGFALSFIAVPAAIDGDWLLGAGALIGLGIWIGIPLLDPAARSRIMLLTGFLWMLFGTALPPIANVILDDGDSFIVRGTITRVGQPGGKSGTFTVRFTGGLSPGDTAPHKIDVPRRYHSAAQSGGEIVIVARPGAFGVPWAQSLAVGPPTAPTAPVP